MPITSKLDSGGGGISASDNTTWTGINNFNFPIIASVKNQFGGWAPARSSGAVGDFGICDAALITQNAGAVGRDTDGHFFQQNTAAASGSEGSIRTAGSTTALINLPQLTYQFKLDSIADIRFFAGLSTNLAVLGADDPAFQYIGLQYSTNRADTNFQVATENSAQSLTDTGVAADTSFHTLIITVESTSSVTVELRDDTNTQEYFGTITTQLPTSSTDLNLHIGLQSLTTAVKTIYQYNAYIINRSN